MWKWADFHKLAALKTNPIPASSPEGDSVQFEYLFFFFFFFFMLKLLFILHMLNSCVHVLNMSALQRLEFKTHYAKISRREVVLWSPEWWKRPSKFPTKYCICRLWRTVNLLTVVLEVTFAKKAATTNTKVLNIKFCTETVRVSFRFLITKEKSQRSKIVTFPTFTITVIFHFIS